MIFTKTMLYVIIFMTYSLLGIESVSLKALIGYLPITVEHNDFVPTIGKACILYNLYHIQNTILINDSSDINNIPNTIINYYAIQVHGPEFQRTLVQLLKFMDTTTVLTYGNFLVELFYLIKDFSITGSLEIAGQFKNKLDTLMESGLWSRIIDDWTSNAMREKLILVCNHIQSIFTDNNDVDYMVNLLNSPQELTNDHLVRMNYAILIYQLTSNIVGTNDININLNTLLQEDTHIAIKLLFGHYENLMCIYSEFNETVIKVNSFQQAKFKCLKDYLNVIFKEYIEIYILSEKMFNIISLYTYNDISTTYKNKMVLYHIMFRNYFSPNITECNTPDGQLDQDSLNMISNTLYQPDDKIYYEMPNTDMKYLHYLLVDTHFHNWGISINHALSMSLCQNCKPYTWISIDFKTLNYKFLGPRIDRFTFMDEINRLQHSRLASEYTVSFIIEFINANRTLLPVNNQ